MRRTAVMLALAALYTGCGSSSVNFDRTDEAFIPRTRPAASEVVFQVGRIERPHRVIGVITAELGKDARRPQLDALLIKKAREIGADGVMLVEYDVDRDVYLERHRVVGRGPWRHHVVATHRRVEVKKTASCIAVVFE